MKSRIFPAVIFLVFSQFAALTSAAAQDNWQPAASLPESRWLLAAATAADGNIYAIGGNGGAPS